MKNRYFANVNDYFKYGLLRRFAAAGLKSTVGWMLTPDDQGSEGDRPVYLLRPSEWKGFDPELFDWLKATRNSQPERGVSSIEDAGILSGVRFFSSLVPEHEDLRRRWFEDLIEAARGSDLVFLDPDIGLEVPSVPLGKPSSTGYVYWDEISSIFKRGFSLLVYQQFHRKERSAFMSEMYELLGQKTGAVSGEAIKTPQVLFLLAAQAHHAEACEIALEAVRRRWRGKVEVQGFWEAPGA